MTSEEEYHFAHPPFSLQASSISAKMAALKAELVGTGD
jgi:hypothetical protein